MYIQAVKSTGWSQLGEVKEINIMSFRLSRAKMHFLVIQANPGATKILLERLENRAWPTGGM